MKIMLPFLLCAAGLLCGCGDKPTSARRAEPLVFNEVHASNALAHVAAFVAACTPRDAGTPGAERAALWLQARLQAEGVAATLDRFTDDTPRGRRTFVNVLATLPGTRDEWVLLISHFDTKRGVKPPFEGANDGGSSTGLLLAFAALLQKSPPRDFGVICAFLDGEECDLGYSERDGFHGSKRLARQLKEKQTEIRAVILTDMVGDSDLKITVPRNSTPRLRVLALDAAEAISHRDAIGLFDGDIFDDHQAFLDAGYPAVDLIDFDYGSRPGLNDYWHTPKDTLDKLSAESLFVTGRIVAEMLNRL